MKKDLLLTLIAIVVVLGVCFGLAMMRPGLPSKVSTPFSRLSDSKPGAPDGSGEKVVMRVNGEAITEREFEAFLQQAPEQMQAYYASPEGRRLLADQLIKLKTLEQEGRRMGLEKDPEAASRIEMARANILAGYALQKMVPVPTEQELRGQWEKARKNYDTLRLSHILIAYAGGGVPSRTGTALSAADAMNKARTLEQRLRGGADFAQLAKSESDDVNSATAGGSLGEVSPAALPPEAQATVAALKEGEVSQPVRSQYGVHLFKAGAHAGRRYEEMKPVFAAKLQRDAAEAVVNRLHKSAKVDLDPQFFRQTSKPPGVPGLPGQP